MSNNPELEVIFLNMYDFFSQLLNFPILHCTVHRGNRVYETNATETERLTQHREQEMDF